MAKQAEQDGVTLAIESAVGGGSISLISGANSIGGIAGDGSVSRAEDLLLGIDRLLKEVHIEKTEVVRVAVSIGPGSFTGLRIGIATAMGLSMALGIPCIGVPLFDAIAAGSTATMAVIVPQGRADLCYRNFEGGIAQGDYLVSDLSAFISLVRTIRPDTIAYHPDVDLSHTDHGSPRSIELINIGYQLADHVGRYAAHSGLTGPLEPIYVRNPRFA